MPIKKCPSCKQENDANAKFCSNCGTKLKEDKPLKTEKKQPSQSNSVMLLFVALVFAVVVIFVVLNNNLEHYQAKLEKGVQKTQGMAQQKNGPPPEIMAKVLDLKKRLGQDPTNYELNVEMGNNYFDIGRFKKAVKNYLVAVNQRASDPSVLIDLGVSYFNLGKMDSAKVFMTKALSINPRHQQGLYNLGIVYFNQGDTAKAVQNWKKLISVGGNSREVQTAKKFIEQIESKS